MLSHLLDTNTVIYVIRHTPMTAREKFISHTGRLGISSITYAELTYGVQKSQQRQKNRAALERFCVRVELISTTALEIIIANIHNNTGIDQVFWQWLVRASSGLSQSNHAHDVAFFAAPLGR